MLVLNLTITISIWETLDYREAVVVTDAADDRPGILEINEAVF